MLLMCRFITLQVFENRTANSFFGYLFGNCVLGFSVSWWRTKHNIHHTAPNECDEAYTPLDEDIDTLPIIAWSKEILATVQSKRILRVLQYQHYMLLPLLFMARYSWTFGSMLFTFNPDLSPTKGAIEKSTVAFHYIWFSWAAFHLLPGYAKPIAWMVASELVAGFLLGFVFTLSHNGKEVYNESKDFVRAQVKYNFILLYFLEDILKTRRFWWKVSKRFLSCNKNFSYLEKPRRRI